MALLGGLSCLQDVSLPLKIDFTLFPPWAGDMTHIQTILLQFLSHQIIHRPKMKELLRRFLPPHTNQPVQIQLDKHFPRQKEPILSQIRQWIRQAPEEDLKRLPEWLRKSNLKHIAQRLERRIRIMDKRCQ